MSLYLQLIPQSLCSEQKITVSAIKSGLVISALHWASLELLIAHICDVFSLKSTVLPCFQVTSEQRELNRFSSRNEIGKKKIHFLCDCLSCDCSVKGFFLGSRKETEANYTESFFFCAEMEQNAA